MPQAGINGEVHYPRRVDFVVGHPRSGTNLIVRLLNAAGVPVARHEHLVWRSPGQSLIEAASAFYEGRASGEAIQRLLAGGEGPPPTRIDCDWKATWILGPLLERWPDARFVHLTRDPRRNVIACHNLDYYGELARRPAFRVHANLVRWLDALPAIRRPDWEELSPFERNCAFWAESHRLILDALAARPGRYAHLRLEDVHGDGALAGLYDVFGLPVPPKEAIAQVLATPVNLKIADKQLVASARDDLLPSFNRCPAAIGETMRRLCGPIAERLGYRI
jgi:hypothetical protein